MALLRLVLALLQTSGFRLTLARLPDGCDKLRILRAVDRAREYVPLRALLRSCVSRRVGFMPGAAGSGRVCSTIILPVRGYPRLD